MDRHVELLIKSVAAVVGVFGLFWVAGGFPHTSGVAVWLASVGLLTGATYYCLERAREHLTESWHYGARYTVAPLKLLRRWSFSPADYESAGRHWFWLCWSGFAATLLDWTIGSGAW